VRAGIVGFGKLARDYYTPALRRIRNVCVAAVADPLAESRKSAGRSFPRAALYSSSQEMLEQDLDALLVASPPSTHWSIFEQATARGLPVFMEKPFPMRAGLRAAEAFAGPAARVMLDFNRRFWPSYHRLAALARSGAIGRLERLELVLHVDVRRWCEVTPHRMLETEGGALEDLGTQMVDLAFLLLDQQPVKARADASVLRAKLHMETAGGIAVECDLAYGNANRERVVLHGSAGRLVLENPNCSIHQDAGSGGPRLSGLVRDALVFLGRALVRDRSMLRYTIHASLAAFFEAARSGGPFHPGLEDGIRVARVLDLALRRAPS